MFTTVPYAGGNTNFPVASTLEDTTNVHAGVTAHAGGTKAAALQLTGAINQISVCATAADSVLLPPALKGAVVLVANDGAASCQVFGQGTDTIDAVATATGKALANAKRAIYACYEDGKWVSVVGA